MNDHVLEAEHVTYRYSRKGPKVLDDVSLKIGKGVRTAILGANGAGKSTLFSVLNALYKPEEGRVLFNGEPVSYRHKGIIRMRSEVSVLFQNPNDMLFKPYVEQDVAFGPSNMKLPRDEIERRVDDALFAVGMTEFKKTPTMKLSYGQRKRITLAGVLAMKPKVLIMDEPTAGLDPQMACEVMEIAEQLHRTGVTVIMSSHDTDLTYQWTDEIHVVRGGKCVYSGRPEEFYSDRTGVYLAGLLPPKTFLLNEGFSDRKENEKSYPRTLSQMTAKIAAGSIEKFGTLHIAEVGPDSDLNAIAEECGLQNISSGVYGMSARRAQEHSEKKIDFMYNAPESCTAACTEGQDVLLFCDPVMTDSAVSSAEFIRNCGYGDIQIDRIKK